MIVWLTGQPGAGKTTLALQLISYYNKNLYDVQCFHIDGDSLRAITRNFDYSLQGRKQNISNVHAIARYLDSVSEKNMVFISVVAPLRTMRDDLKSTNKVFEVYVHTSETRGREANFSKIYEPPISSFLDIDTTYISPEEASKIIINNLNLK